jgi:hypothetical protein
MISAPIKHIFSRDQSLEEGEIEETNVLEEGEILERYPTPNRVFLLTPAPSVIESYTSTHIATEGALSGTYTLINNGDSEGFAHLSNGSDDKQSLHWEEYIAEREAAYEARYEAEQAVMFPPHVTSTSVIEKGKWLEWRDTPERTDSSGSNRPVVPDLDLDGEESFIIGRLVSTDVIEHETDHVPDYGDYGVMSGRLALS